MTKYGGDLADNAWLKIIANETAETNRLLRRFMRDFKGMGDQDSGTQDDDA